MFRQGMISMPKSLCSYTCKECKVVFHGDIKIAIVHLVSTCLQLLEFIGVYYSSTISLLLYWVYCTGRILKTGFTCDISCTGHFGLAGIT